MRDYNPETDYPIVLEACRHAQTLAIVEVANALTSRGIRWPALQTNDHMTPEQKQMGEELWRAWVECGFTKKEQRREPV